MSRVIDTVNGVSLTLNEYESRLFQKFEAKNELNRYEHTRPFLSFVVYLLWFGILGIFVGGLANFAVVKMQGPINRETITISDCIWFVLLQVLALAVVAYVGIHVVSRQFDDWIWSTFSGMMFWLTLLSSQSRLVTNVSIVVGDR